MSSDIVTISDQEVLTNSVVKTLIRIILPGENLRIKSGT